MSEERYSLGYTRLNDICCINDEEEDENIYTIEDIVDLLNEKESKIEQYHKINDEYAKQFERYQTLMEDKVNRLQEQLDKIPPRIKEIWLNG